MAKFAIVTDSASNLNEELLNKYQIEMLNFHYLLDGNTYPCYVYGEGYSKNGKQFYDAIRNGKFIKTSLISPQDYMDNFRKHLEKGEDVIYIAISAGVSGTFNSAMNARDMLLEEFPDRKIFCVDSMNAGFGEAISAINASKMRDEGKSVEETYEALINNRLNIHGEFVVGDLIYLKRTGRISLLTYSIGKILDIKPLLTASKKGVIEARSKVRGRKKALMTLIENLKKEIINPEDQIVYISHADCLDEAIKIADLIRNQVNVKDIYLECFDFCSGSHAGPGSIAIFYEGTPRV